MGKKLLALAVGTTLLGSGTALAAPFNSFDPRSMAMGGAGVAASNPATAPFFNPAGLAAAQSKDDFAMEFPIAGARLYDPDQFITGMKNFQDANLIGQISTAGHTDAEYSQLAHELLTNTRNGLPAIANKPIQGEVGVGTVLSIPSHRFGMAFMADSWAAFGGEAHITPEDIAALTNIYNDCNIGGPQCAADLAAFSPTSQFRLRGVWLTEAGVSLAREFAIRGIPGPVAIGITPKFVKATTVDYTADVNTANSADTSASQFTNEQSSVNLDLGLAKDFDNGWRGGLVVKNLIPHEYKFKQFGAESGTLKVDPQARAGVSYQNNWFNAMLDVDLTENAAVGLEGKSRYVALGTEFNALDWAQLRLGYRINTVNSQRSVASAGVGLSPLGIHIDLAIAGNSSEIGAAAQFGFRF